METPYRRAPKYQNMDTDLVSIVTGLYAAEHRSHGRQHTWVVSPVDPISQTILAQDSAGLGVTPVRVCRSSHPRPMPTHTTGVSPHRWELNLSEATSQEAQRPQELISPVIRLLIVMTPIVDDHEAIIPSLE